MKSNCKVALTLLVGAFAGGGVVAKLHAQGKPPIYVIEEIDVTDSDSFVREYAVKSRSLGRTMGGRIIVAGSATVTPIEGELPKSRVVVLQWESLEKIQAWVNSPEYKELRKVGDKYAKFRIFAVEGLPQ
jgi:uncharacterized protein (DUF1330 family)